MRKVGSTYMHGRSTDLLKVKVGYFPFPLRSCNILKVRQGDTEALVLDVREKLILVQLYVHEHLDTT